MIFIDDYINIFNMKMCSWNHTLLCLSFIFEFIPAFHINEIDHNIKTEYMVCLRKRKEINCNLYSCVFRKNCVLLLNAMPPYTRGLYGINFILFCCRYTYECVPAWCVHHVREKHFYYVYLNTQFFFCFILSILFCTLGNMDNTNFFDRKVVYVNKKKVNEQYFRYFVMRWVCRLYYTIHNIIPMLFLEMISFSFHILSLFGSIQCIRLQWVYYYQYRMIKNIHVEDFLTVTTPKVYQIWKQIKQTRFFWDIILKRKKKLLEQMTFYVAKEKFILRIFILCFGRQSEKWFRNFQKFVLEFEAWIQII